MVVGKDPAFGQCAAALTGDWCGGQQRPLVARSTVSLNRATFVLDIYFVSVFRRATATLTVYTGGP